MKTNQTFHHSGNGLSQEVFNLLKLYKGDCLEVMKNIPDKSVDMILCDLPYGFTDCKWDSIIPFEPLWEQYKRILKIKGVAVLFGNQPFTTKLINSNIKDFSHIWYWNKNNKTGALLAKKQPLRNIEEISVFVCNSPSKNNEGLHKNLRKYFFEELEKSGLKRKDVDDILNCQMSTHYFTWGQQFAIPSKENYEKLQAATGYFQRPFEDIQAEYNSGNINKSTTPYTYNPQGVRDLEKPKIKVETKVNQGSVYSGCKPKAYKQTKTGYPTTLLKIDNVYTSGVERLHPTQKPVELCEYLIKTYSNEGETILDNCMGSGSTGIAALKNNRKFIGIELDEKYFDVACNRLGEYILDGEQKKCA